ncbi:MAG: micrococcal nuclease [Gaiellales bacterium]|nr:micrococcal nuclease [Gaiellales bacterium]
MRALLALGLAALLAMAAYAVYALQQSRTPEPALSGRVSYVIDGDTIVVQSGSGSGTHVRLIGIDTPEIAHFGRPGTCYGKAAAQITRRLAQGRDVELQPGRERHDRYGRLLAYVRVVGGPADLERTLLTLGAARTLAIPPNVDRAAVYAGLERRARRARIGLWGACSWKPVLGG